MAIIQISKIQQRSGNLVDLPQLDEAEFGWASDSKRLFIGKTTPNENIEVLTSYSHISFSQIDGAVGNLNISELTAANGQVLTYDGSNWVNRGGTAGGLITLGNVSNVKIDGGSIGFVLQTDGAGNLSWTPKNTVVANIKNVSTANPAVVTTVDNHYFVKGAQITITNAQGMTQLNGNAYYANVLTSNTFSLYTDSGLTSAVNSSAYTAYAYTTVTATTVSTNQITVGSSSSFTANSAVQFVGNMSGTGITANTTYYVLGSPPDGTHIKIATSPDSNASNVVALQTASVTANVYQTGGQAVAAAGATAFIGNAAGTNTAIQYCNATSQLGASSNFTFDYTNNILVVTGNANVSNLNSSGVVTATRFISNVSIGTAPIQVTSTTLVPNLYVARANVSDNEVVTTQTSGTFYPVFVNGNTTANYALASNANISFNAATGNLSATILNATGNANVGNLGTTGLIVATGNITGGNLITAGNVVATGNITGGNLVTGGALSVTGNANVGNLDTPGNITAANVIGNLYGNGAALTDLTGANVTGEVGFAAVANSVAVANVVGIGNIATINLDGNTSNILYGNGAFAAAPITYANSNVATFLASFGSNTISTTGNIIAGNVSTTGIIVATGNVTGGNLTTTGSLSVSGSANVDANINVTGDLNVVANANVSGNSRITGNLVANTLSVGYTAYVGTDLTVSGNSNIAGNINLTGNLVTTSGNLTANYLTLTNTANISANINVNGNSRVNGNSNVSGTLSVTGNANVGNIGATSGVFTGNIVAINANLGNAAVANYFVGDGGLLSNINTGPFSYIVNGTSNVVVDNNSTIRIGASGSANVVTIYGAGANISGYANITGNANIGNIGVSGIVYATGNITGGNITSSNNLLVTGNSNVGNLGTNGLIVASGNITGGNLITTGSVSATGNASVTGNLTVSGKANITGNLGVSGNLSVSASISGSSLISSPNSQFTTMTAVNSNFTTLKDVYNNAITKIDNDGTMAANSAQYLSTQQAIVSYVQSVVAALNLSPVPTGSVFYVAMNSVPSGYLSADGTAYLKSAYPSLYTALGTLYGGNSTHFRVPDLRGQFIRGFDGTRGLDPGRSFGSTQVQAVGPHTHDFYDIYAMEGDVVGNYDWVGNTMQNTGKTPAGGYNTGYTGPDGNFAQKYFYLQNGTDGDNDGEAWAVLNRTLSSGSETRPTNIALLPIIKT